MAADLLARVRAVPGCVSHTLAAWHVPDCDACAALVIDAVLEEAAKVCDDEASEMLAMPKRGAVWCARVIRALKGTP